MFRNFDGEFCLAYSGGSDDWDEFFHAANFLIFFGLDEENILELKKKLKYYHKCTNLILAEYSWKMEKDKMSELLAPIVEEILFFCGGRVEAEKTRLQRKAGRHFIRVNN